MDGLVPTLNLIEPTPIKLSDSTQEHLTPSSRQNPHRLLYRGSLAFVSSESDIILEGVCFIAHFSLSSSPTRSSLMTSALPLALETQRGRPYLNIVSVIPTGLLDQRLDDTTDVQMYIHPQALITRAYFERILLMDEITRADGRSTRSIRLRLDDLGDDEDDVVIYAQVSQTHNHTNRSRPALIRMARILPPPRKPRASKPRPDDPLPRVPLLSAFAATKPQSNKRRRLSPESETHSSLYTLLRASSTSSTVPPSWLHPFPPPFGSKSKVPIGKPLEDSPLGRGYGDLNEDEDVFGTIADPSKRTVNIARIDRPTYSRNASNASVKGARLNTEEESGLLKNNKDVIKKHVISALSQRSVPKDHHEFKEIYQMTIRGVVFALRRVIEIRRVEREEVKSLVGRHVDMYVSLGRDDV